MTIDELKSEIDRRLARLESKIDERFGRLESDVGVKAVEARRHFEVVGEIGAEPVGANNEGLSPCAVAHARNRARLNNHEVRLLMLERAKPRHR